VHLAAKHLARGLIEAGFDTAYSYKPLHRPLGHAFANAMLIWTMIGRAFLIR
jgi:hypothetical protein